MLAVRLLQWQLQVLNIGYMELSNIEAKLTLQNIFAVSPQTSF